MQRDGPGAPRAPFVLCAYKLDRFGGLNAEIIRVDGIAWELTPGAVADRALEASRVQLQ